MDLSFLEKSGYETDNKESVSFTGVDIGLYAEGEDSVKVIIPKGVEFTLKGGPKESENNITGIRLDEGHVDSQADFIINAPVSEAYDIYGGKLDAHDHKIILGKDSYFSGAAQVQFEGTLNLDHVDIQGSGEWNLGVDSYEQGKANIRNTSIKLTHNNSVGFMIAGGGKINVENSTINAGYGIGVFSRQGSEDDVRDKNVFNIKDSSLIARDALVVVNYRRLFDDDSVEDDALASADVAAQEPLVLTADHSELAGRTYVDLRPAPKLIFNLKNGSSWLINGNSELDVLNIYDSNISFGKGGPFKTLTIHGDLSGSNGLFNLNSSLADQQADKIVIEGKVHGEHKISVSDSRKRPKTPNGQVTLVESNGGDGSFSMVQDYVDAGKYRYFFHQEGNNWVLSHDKGAASSGGGGHGSHHEISDFANSLISMRQAANQFVYQLQEPLNARLASLKSQPRGSNNNLWLDSNYAHDHFDSTGTSDGLATAGFKQKSYSLQLGYDHVLPLGDGENNQTYLGAFVGQGHSSVDFNGNYKDGNLKAVTTGIYAGWQNAGGWFADAAYRYSHLKTSASKMDNATWHANSLSAQLGKDFNLADKWVVTPKFGMTVGRLSGDDYTSSTTFYRSKLGAAVKTSFSLNKVSLNPYVGAYWLHDKSGLGHAVVDDENLRITGAGNSGLYEAGLGVDFDQNNHADFKLNYASGQKTEQKLGVNLNYRYSW
ncbi:putative ATP-binding component of a transport system [Snodgrassella communis]|nr:putative ATP-binding component of a transport system [Snodgrassella communis]